MVGQHRWVVGIAASTSILGLSMTSGLLFLANRLVDEFSHPHEVVNLEEFQLSLPSIVPEPPRALQRPLTIQTNEHSPLRRFLGATTTCVHRRYVPWLPGFSIASASGGC